jgi:hypothetical protein
MISNYCVVPVSSAGCLVVWAPIIDLNESGPTEESYAIAHEIVTATPVLDA